MTHMKFYFLLNCSPDDWQSSKNDGAGITVFFHICQGPCGQAGSQQTGSQGMSVQAPPHREKALLLHREGTAAVPGLLCQQSLNSAARCFFRWAMIHKNLLLGNAVQHTPSWFVQPAWIQSLPLVPHFWDLWYKWAVFCFPQLFTWENSRACLFRSPSYVRSRPGPYPASC